MRRVIGIDIHRTFGEVVIEEEGLLKNAGRVDMTRTALEGFGKGLRSTDEVVIEAMGNCMAVSRVLSPFVTRVVIANPLQVKAIAHAHVKTDKIDAGRWRVCMQPATCRKSGRRMQRPKGCGGWRQDAFKSSVTAPGSRTRCIHPARSPDPALSACRSVQRCRPCLALAPACAGG